MALSFGAGFWQEAMAAVPGNVLSGDPATPGPGPYGPLRAEDANGLRLPAGFSSRRIAIGGQTVAGTAFEQSLFTDGQATFPTPDGGFILVTNPEVPDATPGLGGASAIRFDADFDVVDAYRVLEGTTNNCAGGRTPWGTWMSCEETDRGVVYECDPFGRRACVGATGDGALRARGAGRRPRGPEAVPLRGQPRGRLLPLHAGALPGLLQRPAGGLPARGGRRGDLAPVPDPSAATVQTRDQVRPATRFVAARACGSTAAWSTWPRPPTTASGPTTPPR